MEVEDIFVIPDYKSMLDEIGDGNFSNYVKKEDAQLQFIFTAIDVCEDYPTGVKVNYRAYSRDKAIEIMKGTHERYPVSNEVGFYPVTRPVITFPEAQPGTPPGKNLYIKYFWN